MCIRDSLDADVSFIVSEPDTTLTMPSDAKLVITAGGYTSLNDAIILESGRGFDADGGIKPDLVAPAVDVYKRQGYCQDVCCEALQAVSVGTVKNLSSQYIYTHALQGV